MIDKPLMQQLQGEARKAGEALIIISEDALVMEGKGRKIAVLIGTTWAHLEAKDNDASRIYLKGCGSAVYSAAMAGLLTDAEITNLSEALAVARAHKQGGKN